MNIRFISELKNKKGETLLGATDLPHGGGAIHLNADKNWLFYNTSSSPEYHAYVWSFGGYYDSSDGANQNSLSHSNTDTYTTYSYQLLLLYLLMNS